MIHLIMTIECWWLTRTAGERVFYYINTITQLALLIFPVLWLESSHGSRAMHIWHETNPELMASLAIPVVVCWVSLLFFVRWAIGCVLVFLYNVDEDLHYEDPER